jgi:hypothetical protein
LRRGILSEMQTTRPINCMLVPYTVHTIKHELNKWRTEVRLWRHEDSTRIWIKWTKRTPINILQCPISTKCIHLKTALYHSHDKILRWPMSMSTWTERLNYRQGGLSMDSWDDNRLSMDSGDDIWGFPFSAHHCIPLSHVN